MQLQRTIGNAALRQLAAQPGPRENRTGLPDRLKSGVESLSGLTLDGVRVHYNSPKPAQVQALAYTQGNEIHVAPGQEQHLPHEAWHVVQQKQGRVQPTLQMKDVAINDDRVLEREADAMGNAAVALPAPRSENEPDEQATAASVVQRRTNVKLVGEDTIAPANRIAAVRHTRSNVHAKAAQAAANASPWTTIPGLTVCNHHVSYQSIQDRLLGHIEGGTVAEAVPFFADLYGANMALGDNDAGAAATMNTIDGGGNVARTALDDAFNYYIYKICDFWPNLFFWPDKTNTEPDLPRGRAAAQGWQPASVSQHDLDNTKTGLRAAARSIADKLGT